MQIEKPPEQHGIAKREGERRGRDALAEPIELADTVTEMPLVKRHFNAGVPAQRAIED